MRSLARLLLILVALGLLVYGGLFVLATRFEPEVRLVTQRVLDVKVRGSELQAGSREQQAATKSIN